MFVVLVLALSLAFVVLLILVLVLVLVRGLLGFGVFNAALPMRVGCNLSMVQPCGVSAAVFALGYSRPRHGDGKGGCSKQQCDLAFHVSPPKKNGLLFTYLL